MKRIIMMLALTALLVVALSMSALSAFAVPPGSDTTNQQCTGGNPNCKDEKTNGSGKIMTTGQCNGCATDRQFLGGRGNR